MSRNIQKRDERIDELRTFGLRVGASLATGIRLDYAADVDKVLRAFRLLRDIQLSTCCDTSRDLTRRLDALLPPKDTPDA